MLCYRRWKCIGRSSTTVTTSSDSSLSCGSMQRWHAAAEPPKTALDAYTACNASLYPNLSVLLQVLVSRHFTRHAPLRCHARTFLFHSQTAKDIPSVGLTENAGRENDGPKMTTGREMAGEKYSFNRDNTTMNCANFKTHYTVIHSAYVIIYF